MSGYRDVPDGFVTLREIASLIGLNYQTVLNMRHSGNMPDPVGQSGRTLLFDRQEINNWIKAGRPSQYELGKYPHYYKALYGDKPILFRANNCHDKDDSDGAESNRCNNEQGDNISPDSHKILNDCISVAQKLLQQASKLLEADNEK